jgi:hypothetical protein
MAMHAASLSPKRIQSLATIIFTMSIAFEPDYAFTCHCCLSVNILPSDVTIDMDGTSVSTLMFLEYLVAGDLIPEKFPQWKCWRCGHIACPDLCTFEIRCQIYEDGVPERLTEWWRVDPSWLR